MRWLLEGPWRASLRRKDWWVKVLRLTSFHEQPLLKLLSRTRRRGQGVGCLPPQSIYCASVEGVGCLRGVGVMCSYHVELPHVFLPVSDGWYFRSLLRRSVRGQTSCQDMWCGR